MDFETYLSEVRRFVDWRSLTKEDETLLKGLYDLGVNLSEVKLTLLEEIL